jgi:hypothetical protein
VVVPTITTYRKVGAFYIACNGDFSPTEGAASEEPERSSGRAVTLATGDDTTVRSLWQS